MRTHRNRPLVEELEELWAVAVREHGPQSRSSRHIGAVLAQERDALARSVEQSQPFPLRDRPPPATREPSSGDAAALTTSSPSASEAG